METSARLISVLPILSLLIGCGQIDDELGQTNPTTFVANTVSVPDEIVDADCKQIVFAMHSSQADIFSICPDGSQLTQLTDDPASDFSPVWSPDGTQIAFVSARSGTNQAYLMNSDGNSVEQITFDFDNVSLVWLPDGIRIAISTTDGNGLWWWRILDLVTGEFTRFSDPTYDFFFETPAWSHDGTRIAYMSLEEQIERNDGASQIHVKNVDGSGDYAITSDTSANISSLWSSDDKRIAFLSERDGAYNQFALYIVNADGNDLQRITEPIYSEGASFAWSPDGRYIVIGDSPINAMIVIDLETNRSWPLLAGEDSIAFGPSWQP